MNKLLFKIVFFFVDLFICGQAKTQVNDAGLWVNLDVEKKITQKFSAQYTQCFRYFENISELGTSYAELGIDYKFYKTFSVGTFYRFTQTKRLDDSYSHRHRYFFYLGYKIKFKQFKISLREQYQSTYKDVGTSINGSIPTNMLRSKVGVSYDLNKKYSPFVSSEWFYEMGQYINNVRYKAGIDYELNKFHGINLYYMIDKEMNVNNPWTNYIIELGYNYTF